MRKKPMNFRLILALDGLALLAGIQYADQLAAEKPGRLYVVMDEHRQKVYQR